VLEIPKNIFEEVLQHLKEEFPLEGCGILAGKKSKVKKLIKLTNTKKSSISYLADPWEQVKAFRDIEKEGFEMLAIYHSHPHTTPYPSKEDVDKAFYPETLYLIISLLDIYNPVARIYQIVDKEIIEDKFVIIK